MGGLRHASSTVYFFPPCHLFSLPYSSTCFSKLSPFRSSGQPWVTCDLVPYFSFLFFIPFVTFAPVFFSLPRSRNSDSGIQHRLFSPPPHYGACLAFFNARGLQPFVPSRCIPGRASYMRASIENWVHSAQYTTVVTTGERSGSNCPRRPAFYLF